MRPDGYGRWQQAGGEVDFFLEYDRGTEDLGRLLAKVDAYAELAAVSRIATPVLFWLPTAAREERFRAAAARPGVPVATASGPAGAGPAGPVWLPLPADAHARRRPLAALATL